MAPQTNLLLEAGKKLTHPKSGEEIVISGLAGRFPDSKNVSEFQDNLFNKRDMVTKDNRRWEIDHPDIPHLTGKVDNIEKFDASFFGIHCRQGHSLDPMSRVFLETVMEAIFDAGLHPSDFEGTNTGVFVGACFSESEKFWLYHSKESQTYAMTGVERNIIANRVSYFLKLKGPSIICDTACSSAIYALDLAYLSIRNGSCDAAIVGGTNLCMNPNLSLQFARYGALCLDGSCKAFDNAANGYARSETITAIILQKAKSAKRIYATLLHCKTNCDGYKDNGISYPSRDMQVKLYEDFYSDCDMIKPSDLSFLEAHGTGTKVGDPEELSAIEKVFLNGRQTPLLIGSLKSNAGHSEPASGFSSIIKGIIAFETGYIAPNLHYNTPKEGIKSLKDGSVTVVTEKTPLMDVSGLIGVNNFGFGGANGHCLIQHNQKKKSDKYNNSIPKLIVVSGRTPEAVNVLLDNVIENKLDAEQIRLLQDSFRKTVKNHYYRGFRLVTDTKQISRSCSYFDFKPVNLLVCFGTVDIDKEQIAEFMQVPTFSATIRRIQDILMKKNVNIKNILLTKGATSSLEMVLANTAIQIAFVDLLKVLEIKAKKIFSINQGLSIGILTCGYYDGTLSLEQVIELSYAIGLTTDGHTDLRELFEKNKKAVDILIRTLKNILSLSRRFNESVITGKIRKEVNPKDILNIGGSLKVLKQVKNSLGKGHIVLEIGKGCIESQLKCKRNGSFLSTQLVLNDFLISMGRLYELGLNPQLQHFYPKVDFPVSRGTPMISSGIQWKHDKDWHVVKYASKDPINTSEKSFNIYLGNQDYEFLGGHVIDGKILFPATGYLYLVWDLFAEIHLVVAPKMKVVFENCRFIRACSIPADIHEELKLHVVIQKGTGNFEISEGDSVVAKGRIRPAVGDEADLSPLYKPETSNKDSIQMTKKDVYKELKLRGYYYSGQFRSIENCDIKAQNGTISWNENWITFMDNMLQMRVLQEDTRLLYIPTTIRKLTIDPKKHMNVCQTLGEKPNVPVYVSKASGIIQAGGIEIRDLVASSIARKRNANIPVLEKYVFVPNIAKLNLDEAIRVDIQILLENIHSVSVKVVELIDEFTPEENKMIGDIVHTALIDEPLIQPNIIVLSETELEARNATVEDRKLHTEMDCNLVIASKLLERPKMLNLALGSAQQTGFILSREKLSFDISPFESSDVNIVSIYTTNHEQLVLMNKSTLYTPPTVLNIPSHDRDFTWLEKLRNALEINDNILLHAQGDIINGSIGLLKCIRKEPGGQKAKLVFIADAAPDFDVKSSFYANQLKKQLSLNVYKNGEWGTYRHLLIKDKMNVEVEKEHCYLNTLIKGDMSTLKWVEGPLTSRKLETLRSNKINVTVYYGGLNFRDVLTASGRINVDTVTTERREQECVQGLEFSGRTESGKRVFGMLTAGASASMVNIDEYSLVDIPDNWSMKDAATVAVVYMTSIYGLVMIANIQPGESVLIHCGTGGVGQAAIAIALSQKCIVYTTVGTQKKREFLKKTYPQIPDSHIFSSRDTTFEESVMKATKGRGVDVVLNSLSEEKLLASVRCLADGGKFLEIGKFDMGLNNELHLRLLNKKCSFHSIMLDWIMKKNTRLHIEIISYLKHFIRKHYVRPLNYTVYEMNDTQSAFRFLSSGKHTGKVLLEIRREEEEKIICPSLTKYPCVPRYYCHSDKTYIICGGLGGFGLELADWLVMRGCKKLILTSRTGIKTGYQAYRISLWKSYGYTVQVFTDDITTESGCLSLIQKANQLGPVHAVFNLAVILQDAMFANQTPDMFKTSFAPKVYAAQCLDSITRIYCPELRDFVMFSSVFCGRGNAGQTNYGMSNSIMERICEKRKSEGLPGLAIQWGAIGEVGLVANMQEEAFEIEIGGTLQQKITNCMEVLDGFLNQEYPVVASTVITQKQSGAETNTNLVSNIAAILGIKDLKTISLQATLAELGMDSLTAVEIRQALELKYDVFLKPQKIKLLTFTMLQDLQNNSQLETIEGGQDSELDPIAIMLSRITNDVTAITTVLQTASTQRSGVGNIFLFPGLEGSVDVLKPLYQQLEGNITGIQFCSNNQPDTIEEMGEMYCKIIEETLNKSEPFKIICYSYGGAVALEVVSKLEKKGFKGTIICIDSSPDYLDVLKIMFPIEYDEKLQVDLLLRITTCLSMKASEIEDKLTKLNTFEERIDLAETIMKSENVSNTFNIKGLAKGVYKRLKAMLTWKPSFKIKSKLLLFKPKVKIMNLKEADYGLGRFSELPVIVKEINGNHMTMLNEVDLVREINESLWG